MKLYELQKQAAILNDALDAFGHKRYYQVFQRGYTTFVDFVLQDDKGRSYISAYVAQGEIMECSKAMVEHFKGVK
jgi:hypothetical protein